MSKHSLDRALEMATDITKGAKKIYRVGKSKLKKFASSYFEKSKIADAKADERAKKKNSVFSTSTPNGTLRKSSNPMATKNGGVL